MSKAVIPYILIFTLGIVTATFHTLLSAPCAPYIAKGEMYKELATGALAWAEKHKKILDICEEAIKGRLVEIEPKIQKFIHIPNNKQNSCQMRVSNFPKGDS